jgi:hypothetical protein
MLVPERPDEFCPAMNVASLILFMDWKTQETGSVMVKPIRDGVQEPRVTFFGEPLLADGQWKDPDNGNQFASAVSAAHTAVGYKQVP